MMQALTSQEVLQRSAEVSKGEDGSYNLNIIKADGTKHVGVRGQSLQLTTAAADLFNSNNLLQQSNRKQRRAMQEAEKKAQKKGAGALNAESKKTVRQFIVGIDPDRAAMFLECVHMLNILGNCTSTLLENIEQLFGEMADKSTINAIKKGVEAADNIINRLYLTKPDCKNSEERFKEVQLDGKRIYDIMNVLATYGHLEKNEEVGVDGDYMLTAVEHAIDRVLPTDVILSYRRYLGRQLQKVWNRGL